MRNRLLKLVEQAPPDRMLTLTADTKAFDSPEHAARRMAWAFGRLIAKMRRFAAGRPLEYLAVWERTKAGWPHLHVLLRGPYVPHALVSRWWAALASSPVVWFTYLAGARAGARYVTKYLTKDPDPYNQGRALRASRGFLVEPMRPQGQRYCTLGKARVYEASVWDWLAERSNALDLVALDTTGQVLAGPWSLFTGSDTMKWWLWDAQRRAVSHRELPPSAGPPVPWGTLWLDREDGTPIPVESEEPKPPEARLQSRTAEAKTPRPPERVSPRLRGF